MQRALAATQGGAVVRDGALPQPGGHDHGRVRAGVAAVGLDRPEQEGARRLPPSGAHRGTRGKPGLGGGGDVFLRVYSWFLCRFG